ncbi:MAG: alpha/beta hydrolase, partial [Candidatus Eremiobacteraeota bacterium]|nr:alpha/beta hydrolase [Candidatus Eremiobacteraeota bacterium]
MNGLILDIIGRGREMILALHGAPGTDHRLFRPELDRLGNFARLVYVDLPGHGRTPPPTDWSMATMAEIVEDVRRYARVERLSVLGSSYGGFIALHAALAQPKTISRLLLVDTAGSDAFRAASIDRAEELATPEQRVAFDRLWSDALVDDDDFRRTWRVLFPLYFSRATEAQIDAFAARTSYRLATRRAILPTMSGWDLTARLRALTMPALVIVG